MKNLIILVAITILAVSCDSPSRKYHETAKKETIDTIKYPSFYGIQIGQKYHKETTEFMTTIANQTANVKVYLTPSKTVYRISAKFYGVSYHKSRQFMLSINKVYKTNFSFAMPANAMNNVEHYTAGLSKVNKTLFVVNVQHYKTPSEHNKFDIVFLMEDKSLLNNELKSDFESVMAQK